MRGFLASSIGVTCAAALALPLTAPAAATTTTTTGAATAAARTAGAAAAGPAGAAASRSLAGSTRSLAGSTQSLALEPVAPASRDRVLGAVPEEGLYRGKVHRFSMVGVAWADPRRALDGRVQVRTRSVGTGAWTGWQDIETHNADHGADPGTAEAASGRRRGGTAPLWTGDSDGVQVRVRPGGSGRPAAPLPAGLRLELVDPGGEDAPPDDSATQEDAEEDTRIGVVDAEATAAEADADLAPLGAKAIPALDRTETERELYDLRGDELTEQQRAKPYIGPRPRIVTRRGWGADEGLREKGFVYTHQVKAAFVHHTVTGNKYTCAQAPSVIRGIYRYHVVSMGWRDIGYNFLVDKCGTIYEGRAGGVAEPVLGAHTLGFNTDSMGIAVIGTFTKSKPSTAAVEAVAKLTAWKLGLYGGNPSGKTYLKSGGGNLYRKGKNVRLNVISGHRDGFATECPGRLLYGKLGTARSTAAHYQGRR
ncbi:N-acetylmuramoyl-L-alanine amidase [Streptomyces mangrovisoli]|uniref:N-acetylmuramoyl-L-alanine amidase n=2 Tax=Streptomyces mangrovisoli TaxID=1428628 RepID=A0A1J4NND7_9ACTN|nr:N-acetylmuramoyl-L-alanine amidase [Streptomyces mangrovisoli]